MSNNPAKMKGEDEVMETENGEETSTDPSAAEAHKLPPPTIAQINSDRITQV